MLCIMKKELVVFLIFLLSPSCTRQIAEQGTDRIVDNADIVDVLTSVRLDAAQLWEVHDAVSESLENGYDEEYTLRDIFSSPGSGVGNERITGKAKADNEYARPLREVFVDFYSQKTKAPGEFALTADEYLSYLQSSELQIYWPFSEEWDGHSYPVITFDPADGSDSNTGYCMDEYGQISEIEVTEDLARQRPVWIINRNSDAAYTTIDVMRKNNPDWAAGGTVVVGPSTKASQKPPVETGPVKSLILKDFTMSRHYDTIFQGGSEFFVKLGSIESFTAKVIEDLEMYSPTITDFVVIVKRSQLTQPVELNTLLVSEWTSQLNSCAFMIIEDDGGKQTNWNCSATVKYNSKSYGFDMSIPYRDKDDIVWRGQLSRRFIESTSNVKGNFGDVQITFSVTQLAPEDDSENN